jgi:hypothetical protein
VLEAVLDNLSNKEIARRLHMSERTAKFHVSNLLVKHGVRRRADLLFCALKSAGPPKTRETDGAPPRPATAPPDPRPPARPFRPRPRGRQTVPINPPPALP